MPDDGTAGPAEVRVARVRGIPGAPPAAGGTVLRFAEDALEVLWPGRAVRVPYDAISGAGWRGDTLTVYVPTGPVVIEGEAGMERAWASLLARACPLPEFARGLRVMGSRRGGSHEAQLRFFAPFLQARRRLADDGDLDRRVATFRAADLRERVERVLADVAAKAHPRSAPERRSLEAELRDESRGLFEALDALARAAEAFDRAPEAERFTVWRAWVGAVARVFQEADRAWGAMATAIPAGRATPRRRRWLGGAAVLLLSVAQGMLRGGA